jgi:hypothetical protein
MLNIRVVTWALGTFTLFSYLVCIAYGLVVPQSLHMHQFLEIILPGFKWLTVWRFLLGVVESFLYGVYAGLVYTPLYNFFHNKWGGYPERGSSA